METSSNGFARQDFNKGPRSGRARAGIVFTAQETGVGQFHLQVDRQTKGSFTTYEAAEEAGMVIKKAHPVVRVAVYDVVACVNRIITLPEG